MNEEIDFVVTWVDPMDPKWQKEFKTYNSEVQNIEEVAGDGRFRDLEVLNYMFRSFEKLTPWVRKIHFVTYGHVPEWLDVNHPKINIVKHEQIFPIVSDLPTFNSSSIEMCFQNIKGLSEKFVYFNDDMFLINPIGKDRFFSKNKPNDFFLFYILFNDGVFSHKLHTDMGIINREISNKKKFIFKNIKNIFNFKYGIKNNINNLALAIIPQFSLFKVYHHPQPFLKTSILEFEEKYGIEMERTRKSRFRSCCDLNQYIFRFWALIKGHFNPYMPKDTLYVGVNMINDFREAIDKIQKKTNISFVCFNEESDLDDKDFELFKAELKEFLHVRFSQKSLFEL